MTAKAKANTPAKKILYGLDNPFISALRRDAEAASRLAVTLWALDAAEKCLCLVSYGASEAENAVCLSRQWARGKVKMKEAKSAILGCHAKAREAEDPFDRAVLRAIAQGCSVVHSKKHAVGLPVYLMTAERVRHGEQATAEVYLWLKESLARFAAEKYDEGDYAPFLRGKNGES